MASSGNTKWVGYFLTCDLGKGWSREKVKVSKKAFPNDGLPYDFSKPGR